MLSFSSPTRRLRLAVRTQPSHGWCTGSIPVGVAIFSEIGAFRLLGSLISRAALRGFCLGSGYRRYGRFDRGFQAGAVEGGFQLPNEVSFSGARDGKTAASEDDSLAGVEDLRLTSDARGQHTTRCHADGGAVFLRKHKKLRAPDSSNAKRGRNLKMRVGFEVGNVQHDQARLQLQPRG